jgi:SAM-dependent methyltransferase
LRAVRKKEHKIAVWDERDASQYDATSAHMFDPRVLGPTVDFLADVAGGGAALEFAIGTGRVAIPLHQRGVPVYGIELSSAMAAQLEAKQEAAGIEVTIGSYTDTRVEGTFDLVYLVYNSIQNVITQDEQVDAFCNAAAHLAPGGCFVIEVGIPNLQRLPPGERAQPFTIEPHHLGFDEYYLTEQILYSHHYFIEGDKVEFFSGAYRYAFPGEYDLMARIAGMKLRERWNDWDRSPFTDQSRKHISVWEKPA